MDLRYLDVSRKRNRVRRTAGSVKGHDVALVNRELCSSGNSATHPGVCVASTAADVRRAAGAASCQVTSLRRRICVGHGNRSRGIGKAAGRQDHDTMRHVRRAHGTLVRPWCDRCGVRLGSAGSRAATADVIAIHHPAWVVSAGFAAALADDLRRGHILMADRVVDLQHRELAVGMQMDRQAVEATPGLHVGRLLTIDRLVHQPDRKRELGREYGALACDMETKASAEVCGRDKVRFLSVRVISDALDDRWPPEIEALMDQKSWAGKLAQPPAPCSTAPPGSRTGSGCRKRPRKPQRGWRNSVSALSRNSRLEVG